jgi:putative ABC transport system permease protein
MLGVIIGVAAVIAMVGIGSGARKRVEGLFSSYDSNKISLTAWMPGHGLKGFGSPPPGDGVLLDDYFAIRSRIAGVSEVSVEAASPAIGSAGANGRSVPAQAVGVDVDGVDLSGRHVVAGSNFGAADVREAASVCLINQMLATDLFDRDDPLGRTIRLKQLPFVVIGVISDKLNSFERQPSARDHMVLLPYTSVLRRIDRRAGLSISLRAASVAELPRIRQEVNDLVEERRGPRKAQFFISDISDSVKAYTQGTDTMTALLASIAGISLLVGGIGIMNIMLVSVTERTREIGIRLAVGAHGRDILRQFIVEAGVLGVLGGLLGIGLGVGAARIITLVNGWPTEVTPASILIAFCTSAVIGVFFGWYPARKASQLDPIDALRYE